MGMHQEAPPVFSTHRHGKDLYIPLRTFNKQKEQRFTKHKENEKSFAEEPSQPSQVPYVHRALTSHPNTQNTQKEKKNVIQKG